MTIPLETFDIVVPGMPPFGFRLVQKLIDNSLVVNKLRHQGKAWEAGLMEGDVLVAVNSRNCEGFNCTQALNIIDSSSLPLVLTIRRKAGLKPPPQQHSVPVRSGYVPLKQTSKVISASHPLPWQQASAPPNNQTSLLIFNSSSQPPSSISPSKLPFSPQPFKPTTQPFYLSHQPPQHPLSPFQHQTPHHQPSQHVVTRQFNLATTSHTQPHEATRIFVGTTRHSLTSNEETVIVKFGEQVSKKIEDGDDKSFVDPPSIGPPTNKYPTVEEQVQLARRVAQSVLAPININTKGHKMFLKAKERAAKYTTGADDEDVENAFIVPGKLHDMAKKIAYVPKLPTETTKERINAMSSEEIELLKLQERKNLHTGVSPQMCFNLASDLKNMRGKGGRMFAKRQAKAKTWAVGAGEEEKEDEGDSNKQKKVMDSINIRHSMENKGTEPTKPQLGYGKPAPFSAQRQDAAERLENLLKNSKSLYSPWDAADKFGNVEKAFEHLKSAQPSRYSAHWDSSSFQQPPFASHTTVSPMSQSYNPVPFNPSMAYSDL